MQSKLANLATDSLNKKFDTDLLIKKVDLSLLGSVVLKDIEIRDHHKDTLIFVKNLSTSLLDFKKIVSGTVLLNSVDLEDAHLHMKTYEGEQTDNLSLFIAKFNANTPKDSLKPPFVLKTDNIYVTNLNYRLVNQNNQKPLTYEVKKAGGNFQDFSIIGPNVSSHIRGLYFTESYGLQVKNLTTDFLYSLTKMQFRKTTIETQNSKVVGNIDFLYKREDFKNFNDKVLLKAAFEKSAFSIDDLQKFYKELDGNDLLTFTGTVLGTLNDFKASDLKISSKNGFKVDGDLSFKNSVNRENGFVFKGDLNNVTATYENLKALLPNVLGKTLPKEFVRFGRFSLKGFVEATLDNVVAKVLVNSEIGKLTSNITIKNINTPANATYKGELGLVHFNMGRFLKSPLLKNISLKGFVEGKGFDFENLNTTFIGTLSELDFKGYTYTNITTNGQYQNNKFDGDLQVDDEHFKMNFKGLADLSSKVHKYDFDADIALLDLKQTHLFTRDSTAILKGKIRVDIEGSTFDNLLGNASFNDVLYTNQKKEFRFKEFKLNSVVKDGVKQINLVSEDIANGYLKGRFTFAELLPVAQNALGSLYTNYTPNQVADNQFLDFNFSVHNQIVNVFFPEVFIDDNTKIKGKVDAGKNKLKLAITSPRIAAFGNEIKDIRLLTDNQNPLYNTSLTASSLDTEYYKLSKLNLLNRTENDTLYFKSVFKGKDINKEKFNLDFYYTINPAGKSVIAFQESSFNFKENTWEINPNKQNSDKITFDLQAKEFDFTQFKLTSNDQEIEFNGSLKGDTDKVLLADFTRVNLDSFLPKIDSLDIKGVFSGSLDFVQKEGVYNPEAMLLVEEFEINNFKQGDLVLNIVGDNSYEKYNVDFYLNKEDVKSFEAKGVIDFSTKKPLVDLNVFLEDFSLNAFSPLGQNVLSSVRGTASGDVNLQGFLGNPEMKGTLRLKDAGLMFPYLNVDYDFVGESLVLLDQQRFVFKNVDLKDVKYGTKGTLDGEIAHQNFHQWFLNLKINTDNLLALDTKNSEEAAYYGTAFFKGAASITGLTDQITIDIDGSTQPGTVFVVPLKDVATVNNYKLIHFKSDTIKVADRQKELAIDALKGLSLNLNLEVTKDAKAQVVIDEVYGSQLTGYGTGLLDIQINTRGKFNIFGDYTIDSGVYDFKYGGLVNRPFIIQKGGTVSWSGDPYEANLNVSAIYKARANPSVLLQNFNSSRSIEVDLVTKITGGLFSSKQELDIELPNVDPSIATELEFVLNDNNVNEKTTQFISLLTLGSFVNPDKINFDSTSAITSTASNALASAFSSLINSPDSKFEFGVNYIQGEDNSDTDRLDIDNQVDVSVSTNVSDRVIINGKVGVPVGTKTQSSVIGEVKVEVLLNKEGNFRAVIFNRQNEIQYSTEEEGYTQGVGLSYQVNFNTFSQLLRKIRSKKQKETSKTKKKSPIITEK